MRKIKFEERILVPKMWGRALQRCEVGFTGDGEAEKGLLSEYLGLRPCFGVAHRRSKT